MSLQTKIIPAFDEETVHGLTIVNASGVRLVGDRELADGFLKAVSNALVGNSLASPVFEIEGFIEAELAVPCLAAVAGQAKIEVNGRVYDAWRALPVPAGGSVRVTTENKVAYLAFSGLSGHPGSVKPGARFPVRPISELGADLAALRVPPSLVRKYYSGEPREKLLERILRHLRLACEMARRGAKLVRVRVGESVYDVWVEEIE